MSNNSIISKFWVFFQALGKTFMLPVALLAFMGLILGLGTSFTSPSAIENFPFISNSFFQVIFRFMSAIGGFAFTYLPVLFAIAIPSGLARYENGTAAFSGFVGYIIMNLSINFYLSQTNQSAGLEDLHTAGQGIVMGIQTLEMGVLGGIIVGIIVHLLHNRFYDVQLPDSFAFFGGKRFVPIITSLVMSIIGLLIPTVWPIFGAIISDIGNLISKAGIFGPFLFGAGERLLIPLGMHHILVAMIRFTEAGGTAMVDGQTVHGALNIFYAQLQSGEVISPSATAFLSQGKMPTFMFGLPGAAFAIYKTARPQEHKLIRGLLISGFIAAFITGITEPIEFLFLFAAPMLYLFHVVMTGLGFMMMALLGVVIGNTDGGILDFIVFGLMQGLYTKWYLVIIVGILWFAIYYFIFYYAIIKFNIQTPGREQVSKNKKEELTCKKHGKHDIQKILKALGGKKNIKIIDNCITRLRLVLEDTSIIDKDSLKRCGVLGVVVIDDNNVQVIIGTQVSSVKSALEKIIT